MYIEAIYKIGGVQQLILDFMMTVQLIKVYG